MKQKTDESCIACGQAAEQRQLVAMLDPKTGWFSTQQWICDNCYADHLVCLPSHMPKREGEFQAAGIIQKGEVIGQKGQFEQRAPEAQAGGSHRKRGLPEIRSRLEAIHPEMMAWVRETLTAGWAQDSFPSTVMLLLAGAAMELYNNNATGELKRDADGRQRIEKARKAAELMAQHLRECDAAREDSLPSEAISLFLAELIQRLLGAFALECPEAFAPPTAKPRSKKERRAP